MLPKLGKFFERFGKHFVRFENKFFLQCKKNNKPRTMNQQIKHLKKIAHKNLSKFSYINLN